MKMIKTLLVKYRELIAYVLIGGCTTVVNLTAFALLNGIIGEELYLISNIIAWIAAVIFSYITNKLVVFKSRSWESKTLFRETSSFFAARLLTLAIEEMGLWLFVEALGFSNISITLFGFNFSGAFIAKGILAVIVVVLNYIFSKLVIFRKKA